MMSLPVFRSVVDELAQQMPPVFFERLNGGVEVSPRVMPARDSDPAMPRYTLGMYHHLHDMGCWITLYYGSFVAVLRGASDEDYRREIDRVLRHEMRHHMEDRAGLRDLIEEDKRRDREYAALRFKRQLRKRKDGQS